MSKIDSSGLEHGALIRRPVVLAGGTGNSPQAVTGGQAERLKRGSEGE